MKTLDIGCGKNKRKNSIGMDIVDLEEVDIVHDLNQTPYPFESDNFDEIYCFHVLEHLPDVVKVMDELYRISKNGARIHIKVPHASCSKSLWNDPTHYRGFTTLSFKDYFVTDAKFTYYSKSNFILISQRINYCLYDGERETKIPRIIQDILNYLCNIYFTTQQVWERLLVNYVGGFEELHVELEARK